MTPRPPTPVLYLPLAVITTVLLFAFTILPALTRLTATPFDPATLNTTALRADLLTHTHHTLLSLAAALAPPTPAPTSTPTEPINPARPAAIAQPAPPDTPRASDPLIAPAFMPSVQYWAADIARWAAIHQLDPNLVATVMQIESCGHPLAVSRSGAQSLFQVMPFHFTATETMTDPDTNAARGLAYLAAGLTRANGDVALALAGYNGGHSVITRPSTHWADETRRYVHWGHGIYTDLQTDPTTSPTLTDWLAAGGASLCAQAETTLATYP